MQSSTIEFTKSTYEASEPPTEVPKKNYPRKKGLFDNSSDDSEEKVSKPQKARAPPLKKSKFEESDSNDSSDSDVSFTAPTKLSHVAMAPAKASYR